MTQYKITETEFHHFPNEEDASQIKEPTNSSKCKKNKKKDKCTEIRRITDLKRTNNQFPLHTRRQQAN